jgi:phage gp46-like protein
MADFRLVPVVGFEFIIMDWIQSSQTGLIDETNDLKSAVAVALCSDALADLSEVLPDPNDTDRRGWWADLDADLIWGGWPLGSKLWLLTRAKMLDAMSREGATTARVQAYIAAAMQPFVDNGICSSYAIDVETPMPWQIVATVTLYRGPKTAIQMQFQSIWDELFPSAPS